MHRSRCHIIVFNNSNAVYKICKYSSPSILSYCKSTTISYVIVLLYDNLHTINQEKRHFILNSVVYEVYEV